MQALTEMWIIEWEDIINISERRKIKYRWKIFFCLRDGFSLIKCKTGRPVGVHKKYALEYVKT